MDGPVRRLISGECEKDFNVRRGTDYIVQFWELEENNILICMQMVAKLPQVTACIPCLGWKSRIVQSKTKYQCCKLSFQSGIVVNNYLSHNEKNTQY